MTDHAYSDDALNAIVKRNASDALRVTAGLLLQFPADRRAALYAEAATGTRIDNHYVRVITFLRNVLHSEELKTVFPHPNTVRVPDRYQSPDYLAGHLADQFAKVVDQHGPVTAAGVEWHPVTMSTDTATINDRRVLVYVDDQGCTLHLIVDVTIVNAEGS